MPASRAAFALFTVSALLVLAGCASSSGSAGGGEERHENTALLSVLYDRPPAEVRDALRRALTDSLQMTLRPGSDALVAEKADGDFQARVAAQVTSASPSDRKQQMREAESHALIGFTYRRQPGGTYRNLPLALHRAAAGLLTTGDRDLKRHLIPKITTAENSTTCTGPSADDETADDETADEPLLKGRATEELKPRLIGGQRALYEQISYPEEAQKRGVEGQVLTRFIVSETGAVTCTDLVMGLTADLNRQALRAVQSLRFEPGRIDGEAVSVLMSQPVIFQLD